MAHARQYSYDIEGNLVIKRLNVEPPLGGSDYAQAVVGGWFFASKRKPHVSSSTIYGVKK